MRKMAGLLKHGSVAVTCQRLQNCHRLVRSTAPSQTSFMTIISRLGLHDTSSSKRRLSSSCSIDEKIEETSKRTVIGKWGESKKYVMADNEYAGIVVGKEATNGEYVISDGILGPGSFVPNHYHKWEDQTFHIIAGESLEAKIGHETYIVSVGDSIHCPRGVSHYIKNIGSTEAKLISYIFPGHWAEEFMAETSRQNQNGEIDLKLIEEKYGVVYV